MVRLVVKIRLPCVRGPRVKLFIVLILFLPFGLLLNVRGRRILFSIKTLRRRPRRGVKLSLIGVPVLILFCWRRRRGSGVVGVTLTLPCGRRWRRQSAIMLELRLNLVTSFRTLLPASSSGTMIVILITVGRFRLILRRRRLISQRNRSFRVPIMLPPMVKFVLSLILFGRSTLIRLLFSIVFLLTC